MPNIQLSNPDAILFFSGIGICGLLVGSFLNVVIFRLPQMLFAHPALTGDTLPRDTQSHQMNLCFPASQCPECRHTIRWFDNIPVLSFLWLMGRCRDCHEKISIRYPIVELLTLAVSLTIAYQFGFSVKTGAALVFAWSLIALTFIDIDHTLLPNQITLPLLVIGLLANLFHVMTTPLSSILGAVYGYLALWTVYWVFKWITKKEGMGFGDFKLLAMLGAWLGWEMLPLVILVSSSLGAIVGVSLLLFNRIHKNSPIPFGPFLAIGGYVGLLWGPELNNLYYHTVFRL